MPCTMGISSATGGASPIIRRSGALPEISTTCPKLPRRLTSTTFGGTTTRAIRPSIRTGHRLRSTSTYAASFAIGNSRRARSDALAYPPVAGMAQTSNRASSGRDWWPALADDCDAGLVISSAISHRLYNRAHRPRVLHRPYLRISL